jgi:hypothetical protein
METLEAISGTRLLRIEAAAVVTDGHSKVSRIKLDLDMDNGSPRVARDVRHCFLKEQQKVPAYVRRQADLKEFVAGS